jgi:hypothetical protein
MPETAKAVASESALAEHAKQGRKIHPAADLFPMMSGDELTELAADIKANGLIHPIAVDADDTVLDGRNRLKACEIANIKPRFEVCKGVDPVHFIVSSNLKRRHLNESQRALIAARLAKLKPGDNQHTRGSANLPNQAAAAAMLNISVRSIQHATIVRDHGTPELIKNVEQGRLSVSAAAKQAKPVPKQKTAPKPKPPPFNVSTTLKPITKAFREVQEAERKDHFLEALARLVKVAQTVLEQAR